MALRAVAAVNLAAIERNVGAIRARVAEGVRLCAVVKANAYGHGAVPVAHTALRAGAAQLAVATAGEAAELRAGGVTAPIMILGAVSGEELEVALDADAELVVWDLDYTRALSVRARQRGRPIAVHVKLDSGLGRLGTRELATALAVAALAADSEELRLTGAMTHFATSDGDPEFVAVQLAEFAPFITAVRALPGGESVIVHACNSAGMLRFPAAHFDMVRAGITLYGADPMETDARAYGLEPALSLRSYVATVKPVAAGQSAGYSRRFIATAPTRIATIPIGYADGIRRAFTNNCDVLIGGRRYPLVGTVSMDNITVDLGLDTTVTPGDPVTLIGVDGDERQTVEQLAALVDTIGYELLCGISARVPRHYHRDGVPVPGAQPG